MWCDNCLLLLPLRAGAMAWGVVIALYSIAGAIVLFKLGPFLFFVYPEWFIYGGIAMAVGAVALINVISLSNKSYIWTRVCKFLWPFILVISAIRDIIMLVQLQRGKEEFQWECDNGEQIWPASANYSGGMTMPSTLCSQGFTTINTAFIAALVIDLVFQLYMLFLNWRFSKRLEHYSSMKGPFMGGYYNSA